MISTSERPVEHLFAGQNTQQKLVERVPLRKQTSIWHVCNQIIVKLFKCKYSYDKVVLGPTWNNPILDPLVVIHLDNRLYIYSLTIKYMLNLFKIRDIDT